MVEVSRPPEYARQTFPLEAMMLVVCKENLFAFCGGIEYINKRWLRYESEGRVRRVRVGWGLWGESVEICCGHAIR